MNRVGKSAARKSSPKRVQAQHDRAGAVPCYDQGQMLVPGVRPQPAVLSTLVVMAGARPYRMSKMYCRTPKVKPARNVLTVQRLWVFQHFRLGSGRRDRRRRDGWADR